MIEGDRAGSGAPGLDPALVKAIARGRQWFQNLVSGRAASLVWLVASDPSIDAWRTALAALVVAFFSASQDIVIDAFRVESLDDDDQAAGAAAIVFGYRVGMLTSGAGALFLATVVGWFEVYVAMAALVSVGVVTVLANSEPDRAPSAESEATERRVREYLEARPGLAGRGATALAWLYGAVGGPLADFARRPGWGAILAFVMLYKFGDSLAGVMTNPFLLELEFTKAEIATVVKTYGLAATLAGAMAGGSLMKAFGLVRSLWVCGLFQMFSNLLFAVQAMVGHSTLMLTVTIGVENLASGMGTAAFVAYLSSLCNVSYTATQYALLTSFMSVARTWLSSSGGWLAEQTSWVTFFGLTTVAAVPGLLLLAYVTRGAEAAPRETASP